MKKNVFHCEDCKMDFLDEKSLKKHEKGMKHIYQIDRNQDLKERSERKFKKNELVEKCKPNVKMLIEKFQIEMADLNVDVEKKRKFLRTSKEFGGVHRSSLQKDKTNFKNSENEKIIG
jgi:hypothetical protein